MPILTHFGRLLFVVVTAASLAACNRGSPAYRHIKDLPESQWDSYASTLSVEQRLDLHKEIMERSGHNPPMTISESFKDKPQKTYDELVKRLQSGDESRYYLSIFYSVDRASTFSICDQPNRKVVQTYLRKIATDAVSPADRPDFYSC